MVKNHLKRIKSPRTWNILRKTHKFISKPNPGGHKLEQAVSINTFLKEILKVTKTTKETKYLLTHKEVKINGNKKKDEKHQVGFLDVVTLPDKKKYLCTINKKGLLDAKEVKKDETFLRITGKTILKQGRIQINSLSGINIFVDKKEGAKYKIGDTLLINASTKEVKEHFPRQKNMTGFIFTGKHAGKQGLIKEISQGEVTIKTEKDEFETHKEYVLITGKTKPVIEL